MVGALAGSFLSIKSVKLAGKISEFEARPPDQAAAWIRSETSRAT